MFYSTVAFLSSISLFASNIWYTYLLSQTGKNKILNKKTMKYTLPYIFIRSMKIHKDALWKIIIVVIYFCYKFEGYNLVLIWPIRCFLYMLHHYNSYHNHTPFSCHIHIIIMFPAITRCVTLSNPKVVDYSELVLLSHLR